MRNMLLISRMIRVKEKKFSDVEKLNEIFISAEDLSVTNTILTSIGINEPSYDDCYIIREVCKTVSLRAAKLAAAGKRNHWLYYLRDMYLIYHIFLKFFQVYYY